MQAIPATVKSALFTSEKEEDDHLDQPLKLALRQPQV